MNINKNLLISLLNNDSLDKECIDKMIEDIKNSKIVNIKETDNPIIDNNTGFIKQTIDIFENKNKDIKYAIESIRIISNNYDICKIIVYKSNISNVNDSGNNITIKCLNTNDEFIFEEKDDSLTIINNLKDADNIDVNNTNWFNLAPEDNVKGKFNAINMFYLDEMVAKIKQNYINK